MSNNVKNLSNTKNNPKSTARKQLSNDQIVKLLKNGQYTLKELGISSLQFIELKDLGYKIVRQFEKSKKDFVYYIIEEGEEPFVFLPIKENQNELKYAEMADIHMGCQNFNKDELIATLKYLWKKGYRYIFIAGDINDGVDVYKGHDKNLKYSDGESQADLSVSILSQFDFHYIAIKGNHDDIFNQKKGVDIMAYIEEKMVSKGKSFTYLKDYSGNIVFGDIIIKLVHLGGMRGTRSRSYQSQVYLDNTFETALNDVKIFSKNYNVRAVITGHFHTLIRFSYGNVICSSPLTFQHTTDFVKRMGMKSRIGCRLTTIRVQDGTLVSHKSSILFAQNIDKLYEMDEHQSNGSGNASKKKVKKSKKKVKVSTPEFEVDNEKLNKAMKLLFRERAVPFERLGLTLEEIKYVNEQMHFSIYVQNDTVVLKTTEDDSKSYVIVSPLPETGTISYVELSNLLVGSSFFSEASLRHVLDEVVRQKIKHVHLGGDLVFGIPRKKDVVNTKIFDSMEQARELARILADYPKLHYYAINGDCEKTFIDAMNLDNMIVNPLLEVSKLLQEKDIKFTYINNKKCDFVISGFVIRMIHDEKMRDPYTMSYPVDMSRRKALAKGGNNVVIGGVKYNIGAIQHGSIHNSYEDYHGGIYITTTSGMGYDPESISDIVMSNPAARINKIKVLKGEILKFESEIVTPPIIHPSN